MGLAIDTIVASAVNPGASPAADNATINAGDSKTVRNFSPTSRARIDYLARQGTTAGFVGVKSPRMHDVSRGIQYIESETPSTRLLPPDVGSPVYPADILLLTLSGGAAETDGMAAGIYYQDLPGVAALLKSPADIIPNVQNLKPVEVDVTQAATAFLWVDTAINATENLLKANKWYAVLGYTSDTAAVAVGVKGPETGNLRICGPGPTVTFDVTDYFIFMSIRHQAPYIPVFNANNRANYFVSLSGLATGGTTKVQLTLAELVDAYAP